MTKNTENKKNQVKFHYLIIFRAWNCCEVRSDAISLETYKKIRKTSLTKKAESEGYELGGYIYQKMHPKILADELEIFGIDAEGMIQVYDVGYENYPDINDLKNAVYENDGLKDISVVKSSPIPATDCILASTVTAGKGVMGHVYLGLMEPFNPSNLSLKLVSGENFGIDESAITSVIYQDKNKTIELDMERTHYCTYWVKFEQFLCSRFDAASTCVELFDGEDWTQDAPFSAKL
jgi:hypothetical protein